MIFKSWSGEWSGDLSREFFSKPILSRTAYDFRSGNIYRRASGGGSVSSNVNFDLLAYGYEKGFFPGSNQNFGCSVNVNLSTRPDLAFSNGDIIQLDTEVIANSPPDAGNQLILVFE